MQVSTNHQHKMSINLLRCFWLSLVAVAISFSLCHGARIDFTHNANYMHQQPREQNPQNDGQGFRFASYFSSNMVLQRAPAASSLWGYAPSSTINDNVAVTLVGNGVKRHYFTKVKTGPKNSGVWSVTLDPTVAGGPYAITANLRGYYAALTLNNVMFGDVWVCSGQSNMQFTVMQTFGHSLIVEESFGYPDIRMINIQRVTSDVPLYDFESVIFNWLYPGAIDSKGSFYAWQDSFSGVCYLFGKYLYDSLKIPIGLVDSTWGGTPVEAWSSTEALAGCGLYGEGGMSDEEIEELLRDQPYAAYSPNGPGAGPPSKNSVLWNAMIHPMLNMTVKGAVWYQGEANTNYNTNLYNCTFPAMIKDWGKKFNAATGGQVPLAIPFGFVQLGPNGDGHHQNTYGYQIIRWHQMGDNVLKLPLDNMFMGAALDMTDPISPSGAVHVRDKNTVAKRLSHSALNRIYQNGPPENDHVFPTYLKVNNKDKTMLLQFSCEAITIDVKTYDGFEVCCSNDYSQCPIDSAQNWVPSPIIKYNATSVWLSWTQCKTNEIAAYRYAWKESPCDYARCAVYNDYSGDPLPTYTQEITGEPFYDCATDSVIPPQI